MPDELIPMSNPGPVGPVGEPGDIGNQSPYEMALAQLDVADKARARLFEAYEEARKVIVVKEAEVEQTHREYDVLKKERDEALEQAKQARASRHAQEELAKNAFAKWESDRDNLAEQLQAAAEAAKIAKGAQSDAIESLKDALAELQKRLADEREAHDALKSAHEKLDNERVKLAEKLEYALDGDLKAMQAKADRFEKSWNTQTQKTLEGIAANAELREKLRASEAENAKLKALSDIGKGITIAAAANRDAGK